MVLTIGEWLFVGIVLLGGIMLTIWLYASECAGWALITLAATIIICIASVVGLSWKNTNTADGIRAYKDYTSNLNNGLNREITITAEDGREIFHYEGKVDIETKHDGNANYILFESEEGRRYVIYYGIQDTVLIIEKPTEGRK